jgi:two-component system cell cycle response regulator
VSDDWDEEATSLTEMDEIREKLGVGTLTNAKPCLTILTGSMTGQVFRVTRGEATIGRGSSVEVRVEDDGISRSHARIRSETAGRAFIEDMGSRNGTFVNGEKISGTLELQEGDKIQLGRGTVLRFGFQDNLDESFHENLLSSALRDGLTKLFNKRYFLERLDSELKFAVRHKAALSLLMLDLDYFKRINDTLGHLAGDCVLQEIAAQLARAVRNEDVVARFGGEEIAIVLRAINVDNAMLMAERLRKLVESTVILFEGKELRATVSIGVAEFGPNVTTPDQLVEAADKALYRAKHGGRNRVSR